METFVAVARGGSISKGAERLGVAKSVVSRRLADLEARLGAPLVLRTTRRMSLTDAGHRLLERTETILSDIDEAEAAVTSGHAHLEGRLRIAAPLSFGLSVLQPLVARFAAEHPSVLLELDLADRDVNLVEEGFDLALRIGTLTDSSLVARKVAPIRKAVAAAPAFWDDRGLPTVPEELEALPCLYYSRAGKPGPLRFWGPDGRPGTISPPARLITTSGDFMAQAAAEGLGFVVAPLFIVAHQLERGTLRAVLTDHTWSDINLHLVYPPTRRPSGRTQAFAEAVTAYVKGEVAAAI
ncbi:MAG: LysR family transcriptional regulator [Pseudomonadota bacterium]